MNPKQNQTQLHDHSEPAREGRRRRQLRNGNFQETVVFSLAGRDTAVFLVALNKLHTHFVLSELHQEPRREGAN